MKIQAGDVIGKFKIGEVLGNGGMATVYKAIQQPLGRPVALKVLHSHLTAEDLVRERFLLEAQAIAALKHPGIVQVYDYEASEQVSFISMEYIDGGALDQQLKVREIDENHFKPLPVKQALTIGVEIAEALDYAHQNGIVHRDVKPGNILISTTGRYVLTDFGIATLLHQNRMTAEGATSGTPTYIPPEMITGNRGDERSDIYSLGIVLFQLLAGQLPFDADNLYGMLMKHINDPVPNLQELNPLIDEQVRRIIEKSLEKHAEKRYQSGAEMAEALRNVLESPLFNDNAGQHNAADAFVVTPIEGQKDGAYLDDQTQEIGALASRWLQIQKWGWQRQALALLAAVVLLGGLGFTVRQFNGDPSDPAGEPAGQQLFTDSFDNNDAVWPTSGPPQWMQLVDGVYEMRIEETNQVISAVPLNRDPVGLFDFSAEITQLEGAPETGYGLVFYYQDSLNYNVFGINGYGQWSIWSLKAGTWQPLQTAADGQAWMLAPAIRPVTETNALRVETRDGEMDIFVNDEFLSRIDLPNDTLAEGLTGFYMASTFDDTAPTAVVHFDNVSVAIR